MKKENNRWNYVCPICNKPIKRTDSTAVEDRNGKVTWWHFECNVGVEFPKNYKNFDASI